MRVIKPPRPTNTPPKEGNETNNTLTRNKIIWGTMSNEDNTPTIKDRYLNFYLKLYMLNIEQALARIALSDAKLAKEKARQSKFIDSLEQALVDVSVKQFPETEQHLTLFVEKAIQSAHEKAVEINELLDLMLYGYSNDDTTSLIDFKIPDRDTTIAEQQYLDDNLKNLPVQQHQTFIQLNAERLSIETEERNFHFACYDKTKEIISQYFPEIVDFSGNAIRNIDKTSYLKMYFWIHDFYEIAGNYMNDPIPS